MPIQAPNLDDRNFADLVEEAKQIIRQKCPEWTDLGASDPGIVLLELFAYLTDVMLYRLNRIPDKAYIEFLRLLGVRLQPPGAATAALKFTASRPPARPLQIPRGTRITVSRAAQGAEAPVFVTAEAVTIPAQGTEAEVLAVNCELVDAELAGLGTGLPGLAVTLARPPVVAQTGDALDLVVAVEAAPAELGERVPAREYAGKTYRIWSEVDSFATTRPEDTVYIADRLEGLITFAPAVRHLDPATGQLSDSPVALAGTPAAGREIRVWYRRGGGAQGNLPAETLTVLKDPVAGVVVTNPTPATGGREAESLQNAMIRGPQEVHSLNRAVTARDFELNALSFGAIARARAVTRASLWTFAEPGAVEVVVVPDLPPEQRPQGRVSAEALRAQETDETLKAVQALLDDRQPLGTSSLVTWGQCKSVTVQTRLHVRREEDVPGVHDRVLRALYGTISPLPNEFNSTGWEFGRPLRVSDVYYVAQREPGVRYVDPIQLRLDEVPDQAVKSIVADQFQPNMWYAASAGLVFTSRDNGGGWEPSGRFPDETVTVVCPHPSIPGVVAIGTRLSPAGSRLYVSRDCGEVWVKVAETAGEKDDFEVEDLAWVTRNTDELLLIATDKGLYELSLQPDATPVQVLVDTSNASRPLYSVAVGVVRGMTFVAVATQSEAGIYVSRDAGRTNSFRSIGQKDKDIRVLEVQHEGPRGFLWAGETVQGVEDPGHGCYTWELGEQDPPEGWQAHDKNWQAGSVHGIAFQGAAILAASHRGGVMRLASRALDQQWQMPDVNSGLPLRDPGRFHPVDTVAANPDGKLAMAGGVKGVVLTRDGGVSYTPASARVSSDEVTIPPTWLLCSGEHVVEVVTG
jgi:baseplate J-like protein